MTELPMIVSVDDHVVEPPHVWETWLPERFRDRGPRVERRGIGTMRHIGGGQYEQTFDPEGPQADCWVYEDLVYINKRHVAAVGFDRDDMTMSPITYDEMRPGCYEPKARVEDMQMNHVEASLCFPTFPRFCGQTFTEAKDRELARGLRLRLQRLDGRGVVRRLRRPAPPPADHPAVGRRAGRRGGASATPSAARGPCASARSRPTSGCRRSTPASGTRSSPPARTPRTIDLHAHRLVVADAGHVARRARRRGGHAQLQQRDGVDERLALLRQARAVPRA